MANQANGSMISPWFPKAVALTNASMQQILLDHGSFLHSQLFSSNGKLIKVLHRIVESKKPGSNDGNADAAVDLAMRLNVMSFDELSAYVGNEVTMLKCSKSGLETRRTQGAHRYSAKMEKFVVEFDRFLSAYSGIVEIVKLADAQYGGIAAATLSLLFSAVTMKSKDEEAIISAMRHISDRLPDFRTYQKIYPDPSLGDMLADAYRDVILLSREATVYFRGSSFRRSLRSMGKPLQFEVMEQNMRENFNRIRLKCESLLAQRVDTLVEELEEMQKRNDMNLVMLLRNTLPLGDYRVEEAKKELTSYRSFLEAKFDKDRHRESLGLGDFQQHTDAQCWTSGGSVVFVLSGSNDSGIALVSESWLSPMAVDLTQDLLERKRVVAFELCDERSTLVDILARLIYQLLEQNPQVVRKADDGRDIEQLLSNRKSDRQENLLAALIKTVNLQKEPVFVVLNRPEMNQEEDVGEVIRAMLSLAKETTGEVKVLIVQRSELWDLDENRYSVVPRGVDQKLLRAVRMDQRRI
ncbi:hypothetical protein CC80DRAFT_594180 [Byssothecium circinans]|uniref:DUF7708 domain-containing protein n=1 Tax=Byssothecium circinans TaxID=147558 RepID=A0A6A5TUC3_9PLEO|nr:hypothetical protein CC80DRAFT_594180 [Byssothecium circinans]